MLLVSWKALCCRVQGEGTSTSHLIGGNVKIPRMWSFKARYREGRGSTWQWEEEAFLPASHLAQQVLCPLSSSSPRFLSYTNGQSPHTCVHLLALAMVRQHFSPDKCCQELESEWKNKNKAAQHISALFPHHLIWRHPGSGMGTSCREDSLLSDIARVLWWWPHLGLLTRAAGAARNTGKGPQGSSGDRAKYQPIFSLCGCNSQKC